MTELIQNSLSAGEVAPSYRGRTDLAKYHAGAALMRNVIVDVRGGGSSRQGSQFIGQAFKSAGNVRLIPFKFSTLQTYVLEFGDQYVRFITGGAYILENNITVSGITQANPGVVTATAHGYANGDTVFFSNVGGMTDVNGRFFSVAGATTNTFQLNDVNGTPINTTAYSAYTSGGVAARVYTLATPYVAADLPLLKYTQSADFLTLTHIKYPVQELKRFAENNWTLTADTFAPSIVAPLNLTVTASMTGGTTSYAYIVTSIDASTGEESAASIPHNVTTSKTMSTTQGAYITVGWDAVTNAVQYNVYRQREIDGSADVAGGLYGYVGTSTSNSFKDINITPNFARTPPIVKNPFGNGNYPGCSTYQQQRKVFAGSVADPQTFYMTQPALYNNFDGSLITQPTDAITGTLASGEVNAIQFLVSTNSLIALTTDGSFQITGEQQDSAITPTSVAARPQPSAGCSTTVMPLKIVSDILYVPYLGNGVYDLQYNYVVNSFVGDDISVLSNHLFENRMITDWCYQETPLKLIWAVRDDGVLLSLTYLKSQEVYGWAHHDTQGRYDSVASVPEGRENAVYAVVERFINGRYVKYIERFASRLLLNDDSSKAWCVDAGLSYSLTPGTTRVTPSTSTPRYLSDGSENPAWYALGQIITLTTDTSYFTSDMVGYAVRLNRGKCIIQTVISGTQATAQITYPFDNGYYSLAGNWTITKPTTVISGLDHLEGMAVTGLADGAVVDGTVSGGKFTLPNPATDIVIGLRYICQIETLNLDVGEPTVQGKRKRLNKVTTRLVNSRGLQVGPDIDNLVLMKERNRSSILGAATPLQNMDIETVIPSVWQDKGSIFYQQLNPLPFTITAIIPDATIGDTYKT